MKRVSASVLVDYSVRWEGTGSKAKRILEAPAADKLKTIHDLVAATIGLVPDRGDQLVIDALPFDSTATAGPPDGSAASPAQTSPPGLAAWIAAHKWVATGVGIGVVALLAVLLLGRRRRPVTTAPGIPQQLGPAAAVSDTDGGRSALEAQIAEQAAAARAKLDDALVALKIPSPKTKKAEVLTKHIAEAAKKDPTSMVHVLRSWLVEQDR